MNQKEIDEMLDGVGLAIQTKDLALHVHHVNAIVKVLSSDAATAGKLPGTDKLVQRLLELTDGTYHKPAFRTGPGETEKPKYTNE